MAGEEDTVDEAMLKMRNINIRGKEAVRKLETVEAVNEFANSVDTWREKVDAILCEATRGIEKLNEQIKSASPETKEKIVELQSKIDGYDKQVEILNSRVSTLEGDSKNIGELGKKVVEISEAIKEKVDGIRDENEATIGDLSSRIVNIEQFINSLKVVFKHLMS